MWDTEKKTPVLVRSKGHAGRERRRHAGPSKDAFLIVSKLGRGVTTADKGRRLRCRGRNGQPGFGREIFTQFAKIRGKDGDQGK